MSFRPPVIALVGRPNVGKSTLFNRLTRSRAALVADIPGLTRDRHYAPAEDDGRRYILIDTGGFEPVADRGVEAHMARQARQAILEADLVLFITDARQGLTARDQEIAAELRRTARLWRLVVNKAEGLDRALAEADFHALGLGDPVAISASHGHRVGALIEDCLDRLGVPHLRRDGDGDDDELPADWQEPDAAALAADAAAEQAALRAAAERQKAAAQRPAPSDAAATGEGPVQGGPVPAGASAGDVQDQGSPATTESGEADPAEPAQVDAGTDAAAAAAAGGASSRPIRVAIVGRPNGGKSTLINALIGEERLVTFDAPGTTRDAIEIEFTWRDRPFVLVDTAGIRRRGKVTEVIEKFSVVKTLQAIEDSHVCVMVIDASDGVTDQDAAIAGYILESGRALVLALNKWDKVPRDDRDWVRQEFSRKLHFLSFARMRMMSALERRGLHPLMQDVVDTHAAATSKLSTPRLTRMMQAAVQHQQPPRKGPVRPKMRYAHQGGQNPPIIVIHGSALQHITPTYLRFLEGWFRERLDLQGTPLRIELRSGRNPFAPRR